MKNKHLPFKYLSHCVCVKLPEITTIQTDFTLL